jgi:hypothetical protein
VASVDRSCRSARRRPPPRVRPTTPSPPRPAFLSPPPRAERRSA